MATKKQTLEKLQAAEASVRNKNTTGALTNLSAAKAMVKTLREPAPAPPAPSSLIVGLDVGAWGPAGAADTKGCVSWARYDSDRGASGLHDLLNVGLRTILLFPGNYNSSGVSGLNADRFASDSLAFYKANTTPAQTPYIEILNEPSGTWFWGSSAASATNANAYAVLLSKVRDAFIGTYGAAAPKVLGSVDGSGGVRWGELWNPTAANCDGVTVHPYGGKSSKAVSALGDRVRTAEAAKFGLPVHQTEVGWPTAVGQPSTGDSLQWTEAEQAQNISDFIAWAKTRPYVASVVCFAYRDYGTNMWYGVTRSNGSRKPAYDSLKESAT